MPTPSRHAPIVGPVRDWLRAHPYFTVGTPVNRRVDADAWQRSIEAQGPGLLVARVTGTADWPFQQVELDITARAPKAPDAEEAAGRVVGAFEVIDAPVLLAGGGLELSDVERVGAPVPLPDLSGKRYRVPVVGWFRALSASWL